MLPFLLLALFIGAGVFAYEKFKNGGDPDGPLTPAAELVPAEDVPPAPVEDPKEVPLDDRRLKRLEVALASAEERLSKLREEGEARDKAAKEALTAAETKHQEQLAELREDLTAESLVFYRFERRRLPEEGALATVVGGEVLLDGKTNAVVVKVPRPDMRGPILEVLGNLDVPPAAFQYTVEAVVVSANLLEGETFSIEWLGKFTYPTPKIPQWSVGLGSGRVQVESDFLDLAIEKARDSGRLAILARPSLVLADGETARISSGREIPIPVSNAQDGNVESSVEYRSVALELEVALQEISRGAVVLSVRQVNADVAGTVLVGENEVPELVSQQWETQLRPEFGRWYAVGGVSSHSKEEAKRKGWFFLNRRIKAEDRREIGMYVRVLPCPAETPPPRHLEEVTASGAPVFQATPILRAVPVGSGK